MKIDYTFHSHTFRCKHASGDIEDFVLKAIDNGIKTYGVSDHVFLPGDPTPWMRGSYQELDNYIEVFNYVKNKYQNQIKMYLGFECEYSDYYLNYYRYLLKEKGFDYLICGQHNGFDSSGKPYFYLDDTDERLHLYKNDIINAMKSGLFLYIAHPDLFFLQATEVTDIYKQITKEIIDAAIKYDAVLEVNIHGLLRKHERNNKVYLDYPCEYFWKEVAKTNIKVVLGGDYHEPWEIGDRDIKKQLESLIDKCGIKLSDINQIYKEYNSKHK